MTMPPLTESELAELIAKGGIAFLIRNKKRLKDFPELYKQLEEIENESS